MANGGESSGVGDWRVPAFVAGAFWSASALAVLYYTRIAWVESAKQEVREQVADFISGVEIVGSLPELKKGKIQPQVPGLQQQIKQLDRGRFTPSPASGNK